MENEKNITSKPEEEISEKSLEPTTAQNDGEGVIPVKYNKEIIKLDFKRAGELAQKGMKLEAMADELELLKQLAIESGKTVKQYLNGLKLQKSNTLRDTLIEKCGDDDDLKNEVLRLYEGEKEADDGFLELQQHFPEIKSRDDLPESVLENAKALGKSLFDEFLRYRHSQSRAVKENLLSQQRGLAASAGSQMNKSGAENPEAAEFLKGLWRK